VLSRSWLSLQRSPWPTAGGLKVKTVKAADMREIAADPKTQEWWAIMMPMQEPLDTRAKGEYWADMEEVFHVD
jgi:L-rhamnose mutarotase